jgi:hypothetical protein
VLYGSKIDFDFFFSAFNSSSSTMAPGFTQPVTEISSGIFLGVKSGW